MEEYINTATIVLGVIVLIIFPSPFEDELLYSVLARYHQYVGNENTKITMEDLFGSEFVCSTTVLSSNLRELCKRLPTPYMFTPQYIINHLTLLPYFSPFIPEKRYKELIQAMIEGNGSNAYMKLGKPASTIKSPKYLRYCPECIKEDDSKYGEIYWHRTHQVEGVKICPKHYTYLVNSNIPFTQRRNKHKYHSLSHCYCSKALRHDYCEDESVIRHFKFISEQTYYVLNNEIKPLGLENLRKFYVAKLQKLGLATYSGRIKWVDFISSFNHYYGKKFLINLECFIEKDKEDTWLHKMLRKPKVTCHPLRHILILGFLRETISSMVSQIKTIQYEPFGSGPWPCLNRAAKHYREPVINSLEITRDYKSGRPVGTFTCSCGFVYSRKGPDESKDDRYKIGLIKVFGKVWEDKLQGLANSGISLRKTAEILKVDPNTVKRKLSPNKNKKAAMANDTEKIGYRNEWISMLQKHDNKSITEIRAVDPKIYIWLYRNDREWLSNHYPEDVKKTNKNISSRVDWIQRDHFTAEKVKYIASEILFESNKLIRVTKNEIGRRLGILTTLYKNLDKMPKTEQVIYDVVESLEQFQIRRIKAVAIELRKSNPSLKDWELIRAAGLRKEFADKHRNIIKLEINGK